MSVLSFQPKMDWLYKQFATVAKNQSEINWDQEEEMSADWICTEKTLWQAGLCGKSTRENEREKSLGPHEGEKCCRMLSDWERHGHNFLWHRKMLLMAYDHTEVKRQIRRNVHSKIFIFILFKSIENILV